MSYVVDFRNSAGNSIKSMRREYYDYNLALAHLYRYVNDQEHVNEYIQGIALESEDNPDLILLHRCGHKNESGWAFDYPYSKQHIRTKLKRALKQRIQQAEACCCFGRDIYLEIDILKDVLGED